MPQRPAAGADVSMNERENSNEVSALTTVKELATAVSTQAHVSNRVWLTLMTAALVAVIPRSSPAQGTALSLPFGFGDIEPNSFYFVMFAVLVVSTIAFAAAHAQQVRAQKLAQRAIDALADNSQRVMGIHPRDLFDMLREPSVNRVAALSQLLRGRYQFYGDNLRCPPLLRAVSTVYYFILKSVSLIVYFGLPATAVWQTYARAVSSVSSPVSVHAAGLVAAIALVHVAVVDTMYLMQVSSKIWTAGSGAPNKRAALDGAASARGGVASNTRGRCE